MRMSLERNSLLAITFLVVTLDISLPARAQITNWIAYNDHRPSTTPAANGWKITSTNVSGYDMGAPADLPASPLTNFLKGTALTATVSFTRTGAPDDFGAVGRPIATNTPMARIFYGICDLSNDGIVGVRAVPPNTAESYVTITFAGLDPAKRYVFRGAGVRNGGYGTRWSVSSISANGWTDAHINGNGGPGVLTANSGALGTNFTPGQAAWNSGANNEGAVIGWNDIAPFPDGTFSITNQQYTGAIPGGTANGPYGYSYGALMLAEVEIVAPTIVSNLPASITVEQNRPLTLSIAATGAPLNYQWYKQGLGVIPGATFATYSVAQAQVSDSGMYFAVVYNSLASRTSMVAQVTVFPDTNAPTVGAIFSYPTVDSGGVATLNQIIIEFNEAVTPASVNSPANYTVSGGGNPASIIVTNERSVLLVLGTPLTTNTDYSVTLSGATDLVGNVAGSSMASFHSWVPGSGNGLLMESYNVESTDLLPESVLADPDYPDNPFRADTLSAFDTRLVFPDDTQQGYGARIRGVFIPPVSGNWRFFVRSPDLGVLYLNLNGVDEAGKTEVLRQSTQNGPFNWDRLQSSLFALRAGQGYYIEGLYKAVSGENYFKVAARLAEAGVPMPVDSPGTDAPDANSLAGAFIAYPLAPRDLGGPLTIAQDLLDVSVEENHPVPWTFAVNNPSGAALHYRWFRDGVQVSTAPNYNFRPNIATDNGAMFQVQVAKVGSEVTSRTMTLTVVPDVTPPRVLEVHGGVPNLSSIEVVFNEFVTRVDAEDFFNYTVPGFLIPSATLAADDRTATVQLDNPLTLNSTYQITIQNITDLAGLPMAPTNFTFVAGGGLPDLAITLASGQATISWPAPSTGFNLQSANAIVSPVSSIVWQPVPDTPTLVNGRNTVSINATSSFRIFRLLQP
jgi:hypothetical protein